MIRIADGAPAIAVSPNQAEFAVLDGGLIRFFSSTTGAEHGQLEVALGEGELTYTGSDRLVVVVRTGEHTWIALVRRKDRVVLSRSEITGPLHLLAASAHRLVLLDPTGERPRLGSIAADAIGFEPLQVRTPLRFACVTPEQDFLLAPRDELVRWDPVRKRTAAKLHLPFDPQTTRGGFASRHRQLWLVRGDKLRVFRFSDGRPQGEIKAVGPIVDVMHHGASSRLVLVCKTEAGLALQQVDVSTGDVSSLGAPTHQALALVETDPPWLVGVDAGGEPTRVALAPATILGEFAPDPIKRQPGDGDKTGDWRAKLRPKRTHHAEPQEEEMSDEDDAPEGDEPAEEGPATPAAPTVAPGREPSVAARAVASRRNAPSVAAAAATPTRAAPVFVDALTTTTLLGPLGKHPMGELARYARAVLTGEPARAPSASATRIVAVERRFGLSRGATLLCQLLYGVRLLGEPEAGVAPVDALRAFEPRSDADVEAAWSEVLGVGDLGRRGLLAEARGRLRLAPSVARFIDGHPPQLRILEGDAELDEPPEPASYRLDGGELETQGAALARALGAPVALVTGGELREKLVEARLYGAVPLIDSNLFEPWVLEDDWVVVVLRRRAHATIDALTALDIEPPPEPEASTG